MFYLVVLLVLAEVVFSMSCTVEESPEPARPVIEIEVFSFYSLIFMASMHAVRYDVRPTL